MHRELTSNIAYIYIRSQRGGLERLFEDVESALGGLAGNGQGGEEHESVFFGDTATPETAPHALRVRRAVRF